MILALDMIVFERLGHNLSESMENENWIFSRFWVNSILLFFLIIIFIVPVQDTCILYTHISSIRTVQEVGSKKHSVLKALSTYTGWLTFSIYMVTYSGDRCNVAWGWH